MLFQLKSSLTSRLFSTFVKTTTKDETAHGKKGKRKRRKKKKKETGRRMDFDYRPPHCSSISDHFPARLCKRMVFIDSCNGFREIAIPILLLRVSRWYYWYYKLDGTAQATRFPYDPFTMASSLRDIFNRCSLLLPFFFFFFLFFSFSNLPFPRKLQSSHESRSASREDFSP